MGMGSRWHVWQSYRGAVASHRGGRSKGPMHIPVALKKSERPADADTISRALLSSKDDENIERHPAMAVGPEPVCSFDVSRRRLARTRPEGIGVRVQVLGGTRRTIRRGRRPDLLSDSFRGWWDSEGWTAGTRSMDERRSGLAPMVVLSVSSLFLAVFSPVRSSLPLVPYSQGG